MEVHFCPSASVKRGGGGGGGRKPEMKNVVIMLSECARSRTVYVKYWITFVDISLI